MARSSKRTGFGSNKGAINPRITTSHTAPKNPSKNDLHIYDGINKWSGLAWVPASSIYIEYQNAVWAENTTFTFTNEYLYPPAVNCNLVYDLAADNAGRTVPTNDIIPMIDLIIDDRAGTLYYIGCKVRWTGSSVPGSITNGYSSIIVIGKVF